MLINTPMTDEPQVQAVPQPVSCKGTSGVDGSVPQLRWWQGWSPFLLPAAVILVVPVAWPRWAFMWTLAFAIYCACKWLTWRRAAAQGTPFWMHVGYLLVWPGLDAETFLNAHPASRPPRPNTRDWLFAGAKLALGLGLLFGAARWVPSQYPYAVGWVGMIGIVFVLHFGMFHLLSCGWRSVGVEAKPLMNWPLASASVSEFWGRRWNTAFRDLTHRFLFRPMTARFGARWAIFAGFVFSGIVHELVISAPAGGGYGGPTLFFILQGMAICIERSVPGQRLGLGRGWRGWSFTMVVLMVPVYGLFHPPFVLEVVVPFMRSIGAV